MQLKTELGLAKAAKGAKEPDKKPIELSSTFSESRDKFSFLFASFAPFARHSFFFRCGHGSRAQRRQQVTNFLFDLCGVSHRVCDLHTKHFAIALAQFENG